MMGGATNSYKKGDRVIVECVIDDHQYTWAPPGVEPENRYFVNGRWLTDGDIRADLAGLPGWLLDELKEAKRRGEEYGNIIPLLQAVTRAIAWHEGRKS